MLTLNQHIKLFSDFANNHLVINSFCFGDGWEWYNKLKGEGESLNYPAMCVTPTGSSIADGKYTRTFTVLFCERQRHAEENENDALSDTERLWIDFISYMVKALDSYPIGFNKSLNLTPITEKGVDYLAGYEGSFSISESIEYNDCVIPITGASATHDNNAVCSPVLIYLDGVYNQAASAGSTVYLTSSGGGSYTYDIYFDGVDTGTDVTVDGTNITINLT